MSSPQQIATLRASLLSQLNDRRVRFAKEVRTAGRDLSVEDERVWAGAEVGRMLADHLQEATLRNDGVRLSDEELASLQSEVLDLAFVGGRLVRAFEAKPLATNMTVTGGGPVFYELPGGRIEEGPPVAAGDEDLYFELQAMAGAMGVREVRWDPNEPELELMLKDGSRLTAQRWITPEGTFVTIRRHTLPDVTLEKLQALGSITPRMASFLGASVKAGMRILVSGRMNAGKTVLVRAASAAIEPLKHIITVESQMELMLHKHPEIYGKRVTPMEARRANSEGVGEITLESNITRAQRMSPDYVIVGEIRGPEVRALMGAIQQGYPVMATLHANGAVDAIYNMAQYYEQYAGATYSSAVRRSASNIDISVYVRKLENGMRVVSEIARIGGADSDQVSSEPMWLSHEDRPGVFNAAGGVDADFMKRLVAEGYDETLADVCAPRLGR